LDFFVLILAFFTFVSPIAYLIKFIFINFIFRSIIIIIIIFNYAIAVPVRVHVAVLYRYVYIYIRGKPCRAR